MEKKQDIAQNFHYMCHYKNKQIKGLFFQNFCATAMKFLK